MAEPKIRYFITGGGTGGHVYPAIALVRELVKNGADKKEDIFYLGNKDKLEYIVATSEGLNFLPYKVSGMPRKLSFAIFVFLFELLLSSIKALYYVLKCKPDVVFATGGYVCAPILIAANILNIPYVLHDCDAHPGIVSRVFSKNAYAVSLAFDCAKNSQKCKNANVFGNPIREDFKTLSKDEAKKMLNIEREFVILIMGGSSGAKKINEAAASIVEKYSGSKKYQIIWQTGKKNYEDVKNIVVKKFGSIPDNLILEPYFENMAIPLMAADAAISRAGSLSLSELCAAKLPSVLVPYPYAAADHQRANAKRMVEIGASIYLDDNDCTGETLLKALEELILNPENRSNCKQCAEQNAKYDAVEKIAALIDEAAKNAKRG